MSAVKELLRLNVPSLCKAPELLCTTKKKSPLTRCIKSDFDIILNCSPFALKIT